MRRLMCLFFGHFWLRYQRMWMGCCTVSERKKCGLCGVTTQSLSRPSRIDDGPCPSCRAVGS